MQSHKNTILRRNGDAIPGATVNIYDVGTTNASTIYSDNGSTATDNPMTSDADGEFKFWAADGVYDVTVTYEGLTDTYEIVLLDLIRGGSSANFMMGAGGTPDTNLHVWNGSAGTVSAFSNTVLTLENSTHAYINILTPNTSLQAIKFGDPDDTDIGEVGYDHSSDVLSLKAAAANALQVDGDATAGNTRLLIYDVDNATLERVSVGAADSGGAGFKVLRITN